MRPSRKFPLIISLLFSGLVPGQEICDNSIDDDADGLIDLNDTTDCVCDGLSPLVQDLFPNPSFEELLCQPSTFSQMECVAGWYDGTPASADLFHLPTYMPDWIPQPLPNGGQGCLGGIFCTDYKEYIAACLEQPMVVGGSYGLNISIAAAEVDNILNDTVALDLPAVDVTLFGLGVCPSFPMGTEWTCPEAMGWIALGHATYSPSDAWSTITISCTPDFEVHAIMIGAPCELPSGYPSAYDPWLAYFLFDELSLGLPILAYGSLCMDGVDLTYTPLDSTLTGSQWFHEGVAIPGATDPVLSVTDPVTGPGTYQLTATGGGNCYSGTFTLAPPVYPEPVVTWDNEELSCEQEGNWQWYLNGTAIEGATSQSMVPEVNGQYQVELTDPLTGCSTVSTPFTVSNVLVATYTGRGVTIHAPFGASYLEVTGMNRPVLFELFDLSGKCLASALTTGERWRYDTSALPTGVYVVRLDGRVRRIAR